MTSNIQFHGQSMVDYSSWVISELIQLRLADQESVGHSRAFPDNLVKPSAMSERSRICNERNQLGDKFSEILSYKSDIFKIIIKNTTNL